MKAIKLYALLLLSAVAVSVQAQTDQFIKVGSLDELLVKAKKEKKMVLIDAYFVGCTPCKLMEDRIFPLPAVVKLVKENFISAKIDFKEEGLGKQLRIKYAVNVYPTFLLLNSDGHLVSTFCGYKDGDTFQRLLKEGIAKSKKEVDGSL